jgi:hypothetical protein
MALMRTTLSLATANLNEALAENAPWPSLWANRVEQALLDLEQAIRRQDSLLESPEGEVVSVDCGQRRSQGMSRRVDRLHDNLAGFLDEAGALRVLGRRVAESDNCCDDLRRRGAALIEGLRRYEQEETSLILDYTTTDVGAGD